MGFTFRLAAMSHSWGDPDWRADAILTPYFTKLQMDGHVAMVTLCSIDAVDCEL